MSLQSGLALIFIREFSGNLIRIDTLKEIFFLYLKSTVHHIMNQSKITIKNDKNKTMDIPIPRGKN